MTIPSPRDPIESGAAVQLGSARDTSTAIVAGAKPRRYGSWYVAEHRIRSLRAYLQTVIFTSFGNPLVYLFALGVGLASLVPAGVGSVSYLVFVAPALLATAAVTVASEETTYPMMMGFKWNPIFFGMNAAPISGKQITNGMLIAMLARIIPTCTIYFIVMVFFGAVPAPLAFLSIVTASFTGLAVGAVIASYTSRIEEDKGQMAMIMRFGITPMFLFSGTFFPLTQLPVYLWWLGWISPLWHGAELGRVLSYGYPEPMWLTIGHLAYLALLTMVGWVLTQRVVTRRLNK